ncbi:MAG: hypothetical protein WB425_18655 [Terracidiphilus sp.]
MNKIIVIGGGKGGVGKSTVSLALLDALLQAEHKPVYVETDDSNPDVYKAVNELVTSELCNIDDESGWVKLGGIIEAHPKACIVVNTAARATDSIVEHGSILVDVATELSRDLVMVWPLNRQRDGLELLKNFLDAEQGYAATYALLNTYFGKEDKFVRYSSGKLKSRVTDTIVFPELNDLVADRINDNRLALWNAEVGLTIAERSALRKYRDAARVALEPIYG